MNKTIIPAVTFFIFTVSSTLASASCLNMIKDYQDKNRALAKEHTQEMQQVNNKGIIKKTHDEIQKLEEIGEVSFWSKAAKYTVAVAKRSGDFFHAGVLGMEANIDKDRMDDGAKMVELIKNAYAVNQDKEGPNEALILLTVAVRERSLAQNLNELDIAKMLISGDKSENFCKMRPVVNTLHVDSSEKLIKKLTKNADIASLGETSTREQASSDNARSLSNAPSAKNESLYRASANSFSASSMSK